MIEELVSTSDRRPQGGMVRFRPDVVSTSSTKKTTGGGRLVQSRLGVRQGSVSVKTHVKPLRRLSGFLISLGESTARVGFIDGEEIVEYQLPSGPLKKAGIVGENQPFEMDELEQDLGEGVFSGYVFRPMAPESAAVKDYLTEDQEHIRLRDAALSYFSSGAKD